MWRILSISGLLSAAFLIAAVFPCHGVAADPPKKPKPPAKAKSTPPATAAKMPGTSKSAPKKVTAKKPASKKPTGTIGRGGSSRSYTYTVWGRPRHRHSRNFTSHSAASAFAKSMRKRHHNPVVRQNGTSSWTVTYGRSRWHRFLRTGNHPQALTAAGQLRGRGYRTHISRHSNTHWVTRGPRLSGS